MKKFLPWIWLALTVVSNAALAAPKLEPQPYQSQAAHISSEILTRFHYKHVPLDDEASAKIFDNYLKSLDGEKIFFLQEDIDQFTSVRTYLDDAIRNENLTIPFTIFNQYQFRVAQRIDYARTLLGKGFDFDAREDYQFARKNASWPATESELNELWRKRVKNDWLRLKLAGKEDKTIAETLDKRYLNLANSLNKINSDDAFQSFMTAYLMTIDPHSDYFGKRAAEDFDISMKLSLVGIGAVLQERDEYTTVRELVPGSPAALSGKLKVGDRIVAVGQGENSATTDVTGWRIQDAVALIRGAENSVVVLDVLPAAAGPNGKHKFISLVRKKISLEKQAAKKSIIEVKNGKQARRVGVITLPGFYQDVAARQNGEKDFKSATRDVARLLGELKKDKVDSVLIDLRNNGGGSLDEAIELTGLFIDKGPVLQQRDSEGKVTVQSDTHAGVAWNGPLGVLINRGSASASEIFAAAIQDYGRGVVIGGTSFGKGTVQTVANLDQLTKSKKTEFGELKMTIAQFFRINGGTTQLRGVTPDISFPTLGDEAEFGESSYDNALPWVQIKAADYVPAGDLSSILPLLKANHEARVNKDEDFQYLQEDIAEFNSERKREQISLNEAERRKERETQEERLKKREKKNNANKTNVALQDDGLQPNERNLAADIAREKSRDNAKDIFLSEAANILSDEVGLLKTNAKLVASALPKAVVH